MLLRSLFEQSGRKTYKEYSHDDERDNLPP
jgi:hypothetical protein